MERKQEMRDEKDGNRILKGKLEEVQKIKEMERKY